jgi:nicotinamidase-related amidase
MKIEKNAVLLVIDVQKGMDDPRLGQRNNPGAEKNIERLLQTWRSSGRPIIHVQHDSTSANSPFRPGLPGNEVKPEAQPLRGEPVVRKCVSSAFIGTDLEQRLREAQQETLVVVGMMAEFCVNTTVRMAENLGFNVLVVGDATAAWEHESIDGSRLSAEEVYRVVMATLHNEFGQVVTTDAVLAAIQITVPVAT